MKKDPAALLGAIIGNCTTTLPMKFNSKSDDHAVILAPTRTGMSANLTIWNVRVHTPAGPVHQGQVGEDTEELARCAALAIFGIPDDEDMDPARRGIRCDDDFDVTRV